MEFNIAFNTVFYISIFIIPGILLRRSFYFGEFHKEFSQGNLLERLMWTIFSSIIALLSSAVFFLLIRAFLGNLLPAISYSTIKEVFDLLATNELPPGQRFKEIYYDFILLIFGVYVLSSLLGLVAHKLVVLIGVDSPISLFKYKNYWYYFFRGRVKNTPREPNKKYWYTEADVLVEQDGRGKMYSGKVTDYYVDSSHNQLETIFLEDVKRYKFNEDKTDYSLVDVPGHVFCVPYARVLNLNLTYVMRTKGIPIWKRIIWFLVNLIYYGSVLASFSFFWIEDVPYINFESIWYKVVFFINLWILLTIFTSMIRGILFPERKRSEDFPWDHIIGIVFLAVQFLWIIGDRTVLSVIGFSLLGLLIVVSIFESDPVLEDSDSPDIEEEDSDLQDL